jgi:serine/threonine-protein kinase
LTPATSVALAPDTLRRLEAALTEFIGPIARIVLRKQLLKSSSLADLYGDLAVHIPNDRDRAAFLKSQRGG